jgi:hypothetical protein
MTKHQYRSALHYLGFTQGQAANWLGISIRSSNGYANGEPIPEAISKLLRLMVKFAIKPDQVK